MKVLTTIPAGMAILVAFVLIGIVLPGDWIWYTAAVLSLTAGAGIGRWASPERRLIWVLSALACFASAFVAFIAFIYIALLNLGPLSTGG